MLPLSSGTSDSIAQQRRCGRRGYATVVSGAASALMGRSGPARLRPPAGRSPRRPRAPGRPAPERARQLLEGRGNHRIAWRGRRDGDPATGSVTASATCDRQKVLRAGVLNRLRLARLPLMTSCGSASAAGSSPNRRCQGCSARQKPPANPCNNRRRRLARVPQSISTSCSENAQSDHSGVKPC